MHDSTLSGQNVGDASCGAGDPAIGSPHLDWNPGSRALETWLDGPAVPDLARLMSALRMTRPDGSLVFGPRGKSPAWLALLRTWVERVADPGARTVLDWWAPPRSGRDDPKAAPPLPSFARSDRPLAVMRPDWTATGDLVVIDHRVPGDSSAVEVAGRGQTWIGPDWRSGSSPARFGRPTPSAWISGAFADCAEWTYRTDRGRVTRTAVLLRGRGLALLAEQRHGDAARSPSVVRFGLPEGIEPIPIAGSPMLTLSAGRGRPVARAVPIGLPPARLAPGLGSLGVEGRALVLTPEFAGRRAWLPLLVAWGKPPRIWRALTVTEKSRACPPDVAVGYRLAWGTGDEGLLIYRSLARPALRAVLGHQTRARFLIGAFTRSGDVRPLLKLD